MSFAVALFLFIVLMNRYVFGLWMRLMRKTTADDTVSDYEPTVMIVVPLFNEGRSIYTTIASLSKLEYPRHKLSICVVDDVSTDDSYDWACKAAQDFENVRVLRNPFNIGKRRGINRAVRESTAEIIVSVDSDCVVYPTALRALLSRFSSPEIAAVGGRIHVSNPNVNWLTKLQTVKYHFGQMYMRNLERSLEQMLCLSGCLAAYRRSVLVELEPILEKRNFLGVPIKYGEDRYLAHLIVTKGYKTRWTSDAMAFTKAPTNLTHYFNQQLRWKRSNIVDYLWGIKHAFRFHPLVCLQYLALMTVQLLYPLIIIDHFIDDEFFELAMLHLWLLTALSVIYHIAPSIRRLPPWLRVNPVWFLPMAVLMPVAYLVLTPIGLLTLDSSSWETRGHRGVPAPTPGAAA